MSTQVANCHPVVYNISCAIVSNYYK